MRTAMKPPRAAKNHGRPLPPVPHRANSRRGPHDFAAEIKALGPEVEKFVRRRALVNEFTMWEKCPREPCRRVGKCRGDNAECFDEQRYELKRRILRTVVWMMCVAEVSSEEFYDYLDEVTGEDGEDQET